MTYRAAQTAIKRGDEPALRAALATGLDPNLVNQNGWSLLMLAAVEGSVAIGQLLLEFGAAIDGHNTKGETPIGIARQKGHAAFAELLTSHVA